MQREHIKWQDNFWENPTEIKYKKPFFWPDSCTCRYCQQPFTNKRILYELGGYVYYSGYYHIECFNKAKSEYEITKHKYQERIAEHQRKKEEVRLQKLQEQAKIFAVEFVKALKENAEL